MAYTSRSHKNPGDTTNAEDMNISMDNEDDLNARLLAAGNGSGLTILNGGFELGSGVDTAPASWHLDLFTGGHSAFGSGVEGLQCFGFTAPGGGGNGGGQLTSLNFISVPENSDIFLKWKLLCSVVGVSVKVQILYYDNGTPTPTLVSTDTLYTSTANPTSWTSQGKRSTVPSGAFQCKVRLIGGDTSSIAGVINFDSVNFFEPRFVEAVKFSSGSGTWAPAASITCAFVEAELWGGGGAGNTDLATNGGSGGGGGYAKGNIDFAWPSLSYSIGVAGTTIGTVGGNTTFGSLTAHGGNPGNLSPPYGGTGGTGSGGDLGITGQDGDSGGGNSPRGGYGSHVPSKNGTVPGGGGYGDPSAFSQGAAGLLYFRVYGSTD